MTGVFAGLILVGSPTNVLALTVLRPDADEAALPSLPVAPVVPPPPMFPCGKEVPAREPPAAAAVPDVPLPPIVIPPEVSPAAAQLPVRPAAPTSQSGASAGMSAASGGSAVTPLPPASLPAASEAKPLAPIPIVPPPSYPADAPLLSGPVSGPTVPRTPTRDPLPPLPPVPPPEAGRTSQPQPSAPVPPGPPPDKSTAPLPASGFPLPPSAGATPPLVSPRKDTPMVTPPPAATPPLPPVPPPDNYVPSPQGPAKRNPVAPPPSPPTPPYSSPSASGDVGSSSAASPKGSGAPLPPPSPYNGQFVLLKNGKLIAGQVRLEGDNVVVRQGALERRWPKAEVLGIAEDADAVYKLRRQQIADSDSVARLELACWLMYQGFREQALAEARALVAVDPTNKRAQELVRSLELSLRQFPTAGAPTSSAPSGQLLTDWARELNLTTEGILTFASRAQPVLVNQCMDCHARPDYRGGFRLVRVQGIEMGGPRTWHNLRAVAGQLRSDDPVNSPLLVKALTIHGGMKQPPFLSRQASGYKALEAWVMSAVPRSAPSQIPPARTEEAPPPPPQIPPARNGDSPSATSLPVAPTSPVAAWPTVPRSSPPVSPTPPSVPLPSGGQPLPTDEFDPRPFNQSALPPDASPR
ncbi:MAG: hypothetical protein RMJ88_01775 [Thermogemmata sp.]|nr:hypothetical protein [Thermogemmata sp.]